VILPLPEFYSSKHYKVTEAKLITMRTSWSVPTVPSNVISHVMKRTQVLINKTCCVTCCDGAEDAF
jgi:hypothetical protein